jgi:hypothetical protein
MTSVPDTRELSPPTVLYVAAGLFGLGSLVTLLVGLQFSGVIITAVGSARIGPIVLIPLGLIGLPLAGYLQSGRAWAAWATTFCAPVFAFITGLWVLFSLYNLAFTLFMFVPPGVFLLASVACPLTIKPATRISAKRKEIAQQGGASMFGASLE